MTNIGAEFKQTQGEQYMDWIELKEAKTRTRHILELKIGMEMEWKNISERKLRSDGIVNEHATWMVNWIQDKCRCRHLRAHNTPKIRPMV